MSEVITCTPKQEGLSVFKRKNEADVQREGKEEGQRHEPLLPTLPSPAVFHAFNIYLYSNNNLTET